MKKLRENINFIGQKYVDDPVREEVSKAKPTAISVNIGLQSEFNKDAPCHFGEVAQAPAGDVEAMVIAQVIRAHSQERKRSAAPPLEARIEEFVGHERVFFRWVTPDGNGGMVPRRA